MTFARLLKVATEISQKPGALVNTPNFIRTLTLDSLMGALREYPMAESGFRDDHLEELGVIAHAIYCVAVSMQLTEDTENRVPEIESGETVIGTVERVVTHGKEEVQEFPDEVNIPGQRNEPTDVPEVPEIPEVPEVPEVPESAPVKKGAWNLTPEQKLQIGKERADGATMAELQERWGIASGTVTRYEGMYQEARKGRKSGSK